ncbi:protein Skeletor, isoforms B/C [Agrilus planipennis]|uniref:Protein Skeletor, isoforms B/C n=1 Tax=Agrilus planipennis TaxID=224129 RepID=A0A7F5REY7_AGRPL|nr:protein Skeletor, isoforms B/C [Agrilus planipennis]
MVNGTRNNVMGSAVVIFWIFMLVLQSANGVQYLGKFVGKLSELQHDVSGEVYAVDSRTLHIKGLTYDGQGPSAFFFVGDTKVPSSAGYKLRDEHGRPDKLRRYNGESITLTLPEGKTLGNIKWLSIWCEEFSVSLHNKYLVLYSRLCYLFVCLFTDAKFWAGRGPKPSPQGIRIPDENGKETPLRKYDRKTVVLTLPGELTVFDIGHFGIWCEQFTVDFGHVQIPSTLNIPPSLKMLGVSPQKRPRLDLIASEVSKSRTQLVGGQNIRPTTFRPPSLVLPQHRSDVAEIYKSASPQHGLVHRDIFGTARQNSINNNGNPQEDQQRYQEQLYQQQQLLIQQQRLQNPQFQNNNQFYNQQQFVPQQQQPQQQQINYFQQPNPQEIAYRQRLFEQQRFAQEQASYNQLLQNRRLQEEQLIRAMINRQNRFTINNNPNYNN